MHASKILFWYIGDFGRFKGIRALVSELLEKDLYGNSNKNKPYDPSNYINNLGSL